MAVDYAKALVCANFSQTVYQNFTDIQFAGIANPVLIGDSKTDTQCAILPNGSAITIVFRGSESSVDWETDFDTRQERVDFDQQVIKQEIAGQRSQIYPYKDGSDSGVLIHEGFARAYLSVRDQLHSYIREQGVTQVTTTGHSLGGALANLCAVDINYNFSQVAIEAYTFGAPKVGNSKFRDSFDRRVPNSYQFVQGMDIVPAIPRWWQGYQSIDTEFRIGSRWSWNFISQRFKDHAISRYIEVLKTLQSK